MSDTYTPRAGSHGERVLAVLIANPGVEFSSAELREQLGEEPISLSAAVKPLIDHGLVDRTGLGASTRYSLAGPPPPTEPSDGKLNIAAYSDGDTHVMGGTATQEGGVMFTQAQLTQLIAFVSRPHLQPAAVEGGA